MGPVTLLPLTKVSAPLQGWRTTAAEQREDREKTGCLRLSAGHWDTSSLTDKEDVSLSPPGPAELVKMQCSSLMRWPLRTMSWWLLASTRPTLQESNFRSSFSDELAGWLASIKDSVSPGEPVFDVVQQALGHQRVLVEVHQVRRLNDNTSETEDRHPPKSPTHNHTLTH